MKVTVIIPSCSSERLSLLIQTVESIQAGTYKNVHPIIIADGNPEIERMAKEKLHHVSVLLNRERIGWIASINRMLKEWDSDYYIYASDDLEFPHDCIENAVRTMQSKFPDGDGLVTLGKKTRCCFGLVGRKFIERFPERQVFCPDYSHYCSDTELLITVKKLGLFAIPPKRPSQVLHYRRKDETRRLAHLVREEDYAIRDERKAKGYQWGIDFNLVRRR